MTTLARNLAQATRLWVDVAPKEAAFFKRRIEQAAMEWKMMEDAEAWLAKGGAPVTQTSVVEALADLTEASK